VAEDAHPLLRPGSSAAFSLDGAKQETLVVVAEVEKGYKAGDGRLDVEAVADAVRQAVMRHNALYVHNVVLITAGSIPKTSSGKIQRRPCREAYLGGTLEVVGVSAMLPVTAAEAAATTVRA
jgi:acyl-CoA synthetase (AMP-forming)/AMP-acid ligase II